MKPKMSVREAAVRACMVKKHTRKTLQQKLLQKGYEEDDVQQAVSAMCELSYIDEAAFAVAYVRDAYKIKKYGSLRIRRYLKEVGVPEKFVQQAFVKSEIDEKELLDAEIKKRLSKNQDKEQLMRYFLRRGFCIEDIRECLDD